MDAAPWFVSLINAVSPTTPAVARVFVETAEAQKAQNQVNFLENFFDEVRRKVPVGKQPLSPLTSQIPK
jgi:hypothetical protein